MPPLPPRNAASLPRPYRGGDVDEAASAGGSGRRAPPSIAITRTGRKHDAPLRAWRVVDISMYVSEPEGIRPVEAQRFHPEAHFARASDRVLRVSFRFSCL